MANLYQILYRSFAENDFNKEEISQILKSSHKNNSGLNVTGMLLYKDGVFLQLIEGTEADLRFLYNKIGQDERHSQLTIFHEGEIENRSFSNWSMAFKDFSELDQSLLEEHSDIITEIFNKKDFEANIGLELFISIKDSL